MRPNLLSAFIWPACAWVFCVCTCAHARAQTTDQRPSSLRDAGVITRAPLPATPADANARPSSTGVPSAASVPGAVSSNTTSATASFSDQAWTNPPPPRQVPPTNQPGSLTHAGQSPVVPAQFASAPTPNNSPTSSALAGEGAVRPTSAQSLTGSPSSAQPRPLKPPTVADPKGKGQGSSGTVQMFVSVLSSLGLVIALIVASAWLYRKAAPKITGALPKQVVQVLGRTPLAPRQQLVLLRLGSKLVLVSNLHGEVRTISEITDPLEVDRLAGLCEAAQPGSISESFRSVLHNMGRNG